MSYDNDQNEQALPADGKSNRKSETFLPKFFRTTANKKFLNSTLDQLIQPGVVEKLNGYIGRQTAKAFNPTDNYIGDVSTDRFNYQLEPSAVIKDQLGNVNFYKDYNDFTNQLNNFNKSNNNHSTVNEQEYYAWNPSIDWDKFSNFREYYWLPTGPQIIGISGNTVDVESTYTVRIGDNVDNQTYVFSPDGKTQNPTITLYRGITYNFDIDTPNLPFTIKTKKTLEEGFELDSSSILVLEGVSIQGLEKGISTIQLGADAPDVLYYVAANDIEASGTIIIKDISEATFIDINKEIIGKKSYQDSNGVKLSNGMKVEFTGEVIPATYATGSFYIEGVGDSIRLISEKTLNVPTSFTSDIDVAFDAQGFDRLPYSKAIGYPENKDYFVINRASLDGNLWSRYNRWFHKSVIEASAAANNQPVAVDQLQRAKRPIIEFEANIKLFNFGTTAKTDVDVIDNFTKDAFSTIEGSPGYNVDGVDLADGMRILFTADTDILVSGRIYKVNFINFSTGSATNRQITLVPELDTLPQTNEVVLVASGTTFRGKLLHYTGTTWQLSQDKLLPNQPPLFDVFDVNGNSYADTATYQSSTFTGNKLFSYKTGTGAVDTEIGIPISYRNIANTGDIVFDFNLLQDKMTYTLDNNEFAKNTDTGFLRKYSTLDTFDTLSGWKKVETLSEQLVINQYVFDNTTSGFMIDVYDNSALLTDLWTRVYLNNKLQFKDVDYTLDSDVNNNAIINFINDLTINDVILIKTRSAATKNDNGYYEIPASLERNPKNENLSQFTLGEVNDHVATIVEQSDTFTGVYPGTSNLRDIGNVTGLGRRFLQHSSPMNLPLYHMLDNDANVVKSLKFARKQYGTFKRLFLQAAEDLEYQGSIKTHVDVILESINKNKTKTQPFFFSDMVPAGATRIITSLIEDPDELFFPLSKPFTLTTASRQAVQVYKNGVQLIHGTDYTFNSEGYALITVTKQQDDIIEIYEYETTNGSYIPPTPTKLGLYPSFEPVIYVDNTFIIPRSVIQGHDGSKVAAFGDYRDDLLLELERRIYNNIKVQYDVNFLDIHNLVGADYRNTKVSKAQIDKVMLPDFIQWSKLIDQDYTLHNFFERTNRFTFNYTSSTNALDTAVPGYWREIYKQAFDTDRPHTHPWEMLGLSVMPTWWEAQYGPAPYTKENSLLWQDLEAGILRQPGVKYKVLNNYKRPTLTNHIPTDSEGNLLSPLDSGYINFFNPQNIDQSFVFGDGAPVEAAWRSSSEFPFSVITAFAINKPQMLFASGFDRINQVRNVSGELVYKSTNTRIKLEDIIFPNTAEDSVQVYTSGLVNYIASYMTADILKSYNTYKSNIKTIDNQLGYKLAGFTDVDKFKLILDSRTPLNKGNVFVPDENYSVFLNSSTPIKTISYSGVIIERRTDGYVVKGYDQEIANFKYYAAIATQRDPSINIGGISESFLVWTGNKLYVQGSNVEYQGSYYRVNTNHTSTSSFDETKFSKLPALPLIGGRDAFVRKQFNKNIVLEADYGKLFITIQDVVDFLLGYGAYLEDQGFVFDYFDGNEKVVLNWRHSVNEFLFWTTQNWGEGSVITLSPAAAQLKFKTEYSMVDNIFDGFYGYTLLKSDGNKLVEEFALLGRQPNEFVLRPRNTADGIFAVKLPLVQKEHVLIIDNKTVFGDIIYDTQPGYRQERIKVLGYLTQDWDGSLNVPGFIYDDAKVTIWESWTDYAIGSLVKYKEFYYSAANKLSGVETFNAGDWNRLDEKPESGLYANFEYKTNQFADFYDLDSDNFDTEQQKVAQHLIGYQKRQYLENIINDDVSQYKFYQGMIQDKGTKNALTKLFDVLSSSNKDSLEFYEEWAIKDGQYGASDGFTEYELLLDESKFRLTPQPIDLVTSTTGLETDLVYRILPYEVYQKTPNYNHKPFPEKYVSDPYVRDAGYVNQADVRGVATNYSNIADFNFDDIDSGAYIWVGNDNRDWNVYKHVDTDYTVQEVSAGATQFTITLNLNVTDIVANDIIGLHGLSEFIADTPTPGPGLVVDLKGFFTVISVAKNVITLATNTAVTAVEKCIGSITRFSNVRATNIEAANSIVQKSLALNDYVWIDSLKEPNQWAVLKNDNVFDETLRISKSSLSADESFGTALSVDDRNTVLAVGAPDQGDGQVYIYSRATSSINYLQTQIIDPLIVGDAGERFGATVALSPDAQFLIVGSPNASNVKTKFKGNYQQASNYGKNSIVLKDQQLWKSLVDVPGELDAIIFNSFNSTAGIIDALGVAEVPTVDIPMLLVGNYAINSITNLYAFSGQATNHLLIRAPKALYEGSGVNDSINLAWNSITYANQNLAPLTVRAPFGGQFAQITDAFLETDLTIQKKVDVILYINAATNLTVVGDILQTETGSGVVDYVYVDGSETVIYLKDVNGNFNTEDSLFRSDGDFIGGYVKQGPVDSVDASTQLGGYWYVDTTPYTPTTATTNKDQGRGLVFYDVVTDSSGSARFFHNALDYDTDTISSQNTYNSYIGVLSSQGLPGAYGNNGEILSDLFVVRAPSEYRINNLVQGNTVNLYVNQLPQYGAGPVKDLANISLSTVITNKQHTIYDIWDGYIHFDYTKFDSAGNPFEPKIGQTVEDLSTGATAVVTYYQRDGLTVTIYVKGVTGTWSNGNDYGQNAEIGFKLIPGDPSPTYQADRTIGQIQYVNLGLESENIGKMFVFQSSADIALPATANLLDAEYWLYTQGNVSGIPRLANEPSAINNEWTQVYQIPTDSTGTGSTLSNEGVYAIYTRAALGRYDLVSSYTVPERQANFKLGSKIKVTKNNDLYRAFIHAQDEQIENSPGRLYFLKNGEENGLTYNWDYAKNKKFKGTFNESLNYFTDDIVYVDQVQGILYVAKTNLAPGSFNVADWTSTDDLVDYVGFIPNNTGLTVFNDSTDAITVLDQELLLEFGSEFDVATSGEVLVTNALYDAAKANQVVVYRSNQGHFERSQELTAPDKTSGFGHSIAISDDGTMIAISAPFNDSYKDDQGVVYIYAQAAGVFELTQTLSSLNNERAEMFGWKLQFDGNKLHISAKNADAQTGTTIDAGATIFDNDFTNFKRTNDDAGVVYVYEKIEAQMLLAQTVQIPDTDVNYFGRNMLAKDNNLYIGLPSKVSNLTTGQVVNFSNTAGAPMWTTHRAVKATVDINKIKKMFLYNTKENLLLTHLDYIDPIQGKVAGVAEQELTYKTYYDPALYDISTTSTAIIDETNSWGSERVGEVWWNLTNAKFYNPYQGDVIYSTQNWSKVFQGNSIDVYEWVQSDVIPSVWDSKADTATGFVKGYSGTSLYGDTAYSTKRVYDDVAKIFTTNYFFWVSNKKTIPNAEFRNLSISDVTDYISDPVAKGYEFAGLISSNSFVLYNVEKYIKGTDVALSTQFWTIENQTQNIHNQYQLVTEGLETSQPNKDIIRKWFDSLVGYDEQIRIVPDPSLSAKQKYGALNRPRQSWFVNRFEALKQFIERTNLILKDNLIVDDKTFTDLLSQDNAPVAALNEYDTTVDSVDDLQFVGVAKAAQAVLTPVIENGKVINVNITTPGRGYRVAPTVKVYGNGTGAVVTTTIDSIGKVIGATVVAAGENYSANTTLVTRKFTVLVTSDSGIQGKWAIYERLSDSRTWNRIQSQGWNVNLYWNYIDWYATGYNATSNIDYLIDNSYELTSLADEIGNIVKISTIGSGGWLLLEKIANEDTEDYTVNYKTIGRENGTLQIKSTLYDTIAAFTGFDTISFDTKIYDNEPTTELRIILNVIKDNLFIDDLQIRFNDLFFASLRYAFSEQTYIDWAFKTSFIKAKHNAGTLREDITFNNDNLPSYESYIKEVKPFGTKIREYISAYEGLDNTRSVVTDFDLPPAYSATEGKIIPQTVKVQQDTLVGVNADLETYPNKNWLDNSSYKVVSVSIVDPGHGYNVAPVLTLSGGGGTGATLKTYIGANGKVTKVDVLTPGNGYYSAPVITAVENINDTGKSATYSVTIGDNPVRGITTAVKFDRTTGTYVYTNINETETFVASGNIFEFDLMWPMDLLKSNVSVTVNNIESLDSEYTYKNVLDVTKGYDRYYGQIEFTSAPAVNDSVVVSYNKSINIMQAQDRINNVIPKTGEYITDLNQLMTGLDYGGVQVKSFDFGAGQGWDSDTWYDDTWDSYDTTYQDEVFELDGSTISLDLTAPLANGVQYHVYLNNVRIDDPNYPSSPTNTNAICQSLTGDGTTQTVFLDNDGLNITTVANDTIIIRKSTSDGTFLPDENSYDTLIQGGGLAYSTATGLNAADITIDGDGFVTETTSKGPEELVPGQLLDTVDIKVYEKPQSGSSQIVSRNYIGDGITTTYSIGTVPLKANDLFVKVGYAIVTNYTIDYAAKTITFATAPAISSRIHLATLGVSGTNILDIDNVTADGSTSRFLTSVRWSENLQSIITLNGVKLENVIVQSDNTDEVPNNVIIRLAVPPAAGDVINYAFFEGTEQNFSEVSVDTFTSDGTTTSFTLNQTPFNFEPSSWFSIVKVNDAILNAGFTQRFVTTAASRQYQLDNFQIPPGSVDNKQIKVYLNNVELTYRAEWTFTGAASSGNSSIIRLKAAVKQQDGDILKVYVISDGEYRYGYFNDANEFVSTPGQLYLDSAYTSGDTITVYQFSNHDSQGFDRKQYDVVDRVSLTVGTDDWYKYNHLTSGLIELDRPALDAEYVWVTLNNNLLIPSVHYSVTDNKKYVKLNVDIEPNDTVELLHFADPVTVDKYGWRQFKDILNRTHYKRLDDTNNILLVKDLTWYDQSITVSDGSTLPAPEATSRSPGIIFINGERIEYFVRNGNVLSQLRRGTLGTGVKSIYLEGENVYNQGATSTMPYKDETLTTVFTADGTSSVYTLDFTSTSVNEFEVFVAGKRLRKNTISSYDFTNLVAQDSPEGDVTLPAEFSVDGDTLTLLETPPENVKVTVVRRQGIEWTSPGTPLGESESDIARFLRASTVSLPR
jgi:hypothetical protein